MKELTSEQKLYILDLLKLSEFEIIDINGIKYYSEKSVLFLLKKALTSQGGNFKKFSLLRESESVTSSDTYLNECIKKATPNLSKIKDVDSALDEIRGVEQSGKDIRDELIKFSIYLNTKGGRKSIQPEEIDNYLKSKP